jgi:hypothetical protein
MMLLVREYYFNIDLLSYLLPHTNILLKLSTLGILCDEKFKDKIFYKSVFAFLANSSI